VNPKNNKATDYAALWQAVTSQFGLGKDSIHGPLHWKRVEEIGVRLCEHSGANVEVVRLFAVFHDSQRMNESHDARHGARGAKLATQMRGTFFELDDARMEALCYACVNHTFGMISSDPTVGTCWDSDRLDLWRVGVIPAPKMLNTKRAKEPEFIVWSMNLKR
jgi:uncharacterized protein